ncbi:vitamin K epoxide reductase complex subunit 1 [Galendromus occidentalis]|uniref:vitamin-K-epoxide reductase (warfarin-sensitive) n=1 Tax=Galendromus occidentalis TaxID=34638 RepID=A0AAJ7L8E7_9ACAR|nr:vitamin K epoxide reductase complex subunit 1 [Galendromus occidentalis]
MGREPQNSIEMSLARARAMIPRPLKDWHPYRRAQLAHLVFCAMGIGVSMYALYVEVNKITTPAYKPMCDISEHVKCSRVLVSEYSRGFGLLGSFFGADSPLNMSNCAFGIVFYMIVFCLGFIHQPTVLYLTVWFVVLAYVMSMYLMAVLIFVLSDFCVVCATIYAINTLLMLATFSRYSCSPKIAQEKLYKSQKKYN